MPGLFSSFFDLCGKIIRFLWSSNRHQGTTRKRVGYGNCVQRWPVLCNQMGSGAVIIGMEHWEYWCMALFAAAAPSIEHVH